jgi:hypothetical protein
LQLTWARRAVWWPDDGSEAVAEVAMLGLGGRGKRGVEGAVRTSKGHLLLLGPEGSVGRRWPASKEGRKWVAL